MGMSYQTNSEPWWNVYNDMLHPAYRSLIAAEETASIMQCFSFTSLPGLLQTEHYSNAVTTGTQLSPLSREEREQFSTLRIERQWHVFERPHPPQLEVIIDEPTLYRRVGNAQVLCEQLQHLIRLAQLPFITIRVLPLSRPIDYCGDHGLYNFILLTPPDNQSGSLYCEQTAAHTQIFTDVPVEVRRYQLLFRYLWQEALPAEKTIALLESIYTTLARSANA